MASQDLWIFVGSAIRANRAQRGMSVKELAELVSLTEAQLQHFEADTKGMTLESLSDICNVLEIDVLSLFRNLAVERMDLSATTLQ